MACSAPSFQPQASGDHTQTVANHYNQLEDIGLAKRTRSRIFYLRNFNNWIKSVLIADSLQKLRDDSLHRSVTVLDLCSGKGGDLLKWKKGRIDHVVCADIAATSVEQSETRHRQNVQRERNKIYSAEFIVADCTKERLRNKYKNPNILFDLVSCQFSFHYCFESYAQAMMMLRNACECLRPGGYFIGTTPNSNELVRRLRNSKDNSFGNDVYRIKFGQDNKTDFPLFGAMYNFHLEGVVDCPEFLVYFPVLERMAASFGMKLVKKQTFADFFKENVANKDHLSLLNAMQALEPYPPMTGTETVSDREEDYKIVKEFMSSIKESQPADEAEKLQQPGKIGTLSQAEWEAATLYLVFVFQKVEDVCPAMDSSLLSAAHAKSQASTDSAPQV